VVDQAVADDPGADHDRAGPAWKRVVGRHEA
jgi:hypothetical protein